MIYAGLEQVSDIVFSHWNAVAECHLVVVTVNTADTKLCAEKLKQVLTENKKIPIFSLQRGVKNSSILKDE
jgi:ketopantoate reductase